MIFVTIGSHEPFDRLVKAVDRWAETCPGRVFGQITDAGSYRPQHMDWVGHLDAASYAARVAQSSLLVAHAGMGSIITALGAGKPIVVMPRRGHLGETRNDHQWATARRLADRPGIHVAEDERALPRVIDSALDATTEEIAILPPHASSDLIAAVRDFVFSR